LVLAYVLLRTSSVQTYVSRKLADYLSKELNTVVTVGGVDIEFISKIVLEDLYIEDLHHDTLLSASKVKAELPFFSLEKIQNNMINNIIEL
jgi:hypothetical protein